MTLASRPKCRSENKGGLYRAAEAFRAGGGDDGDSKDLRNPYIRRPDGSCALRTSTDLYR